MWRCDSRLGALAATEFLHILLHLSGQDSKDLKVFFHLLITETAVLIPRAF